MSWLTSWWRTDKTQVFVKLIVKAALVLLGRAARDMFEIVKTCVLKAEEAGGTGETKWKNAIKCIKKHLGEPEGIAKYMIKIFIEAVVIELKNK